MAPHRRRPRPCTPCNSACGYRFARPELLRRALTHRSCGAEHNERLEFLGDAVLSLAVSACSSSALPAADEGDLTRVRAHLVREDSLHRVAWRWACPRCCACPKAKRAAAARSGRRSWPTRVEAVIGAVFLDGGYDAARRWCSGCSATSSETTEADSWTKDAKTELQEWLQARRAAGADLPHRRHARPGPCADLRRRMRRAGAGPGRTRRRPIAPRGRAGGRPAHARRAESQRPARRPAAVHDSAAT